jgi:hypothetical protein
MRSPARRPRALAALPALALGLASAGCSFLLPGSRTDDPVACTMEFRMVTVTVVDAAGRPVTGLDASTRNERTGEVLDPGDEPFLGEQGIYLVATDAHRARLSRGGDPLAFRASGRGLLAGGTFRVGADACHIQRLAGPDTLVARPG